MTASIDVSEVNALAVTLQTAGGSVGAEVAAVVRKGALNVKNDARRIATGIGHAPLYPFSIGYDVTGDGRFGTVEAEIGPDKDRPQGALGNILEYGTVNNAPITHLGPALDREGPRFMDAIAASAVKVLEP